jgi:hypothetical protein
MTEMPKFKKSKANNIEEKLILELISDLHETFRCFIRLNNLSMQQEDFYKVIRDGAIGFSGEIITGLSQMLLHKKDVPKFLDECRDIFFAYMNEAKK